MTNLLKLGDQPRPRPVLTIVKALGLDCIKLVETKTRRRAGPQTPGTLSKASNDGSIPESGRNNTLTSLAGTMRRKGMADTAIEAALQAENLARCRPPLDPVEVSAIASSIMRYPAASGDDVLKSLTDTGNASRFGKCYAEKLMYVFGVGWVIWDGLRWRRDQTDEVIELAKQLTRDIYVEGDALDDGARVAVAKHAKASQQASRIKAMIELARSLPELATRAELLDSQDMLLGVANGVVNLKTAKLQPAQREELMTRHSSVAFDAEALCPKFVTFIDQVTGGDNDLARYLQRVVGYSLTGRTTEQCLFFLYGSGANGKSTFLNLVKELLGADFAQQTPSETLMAKRSPATNDLARLAGIRVVVANEVEDGSLLAEALVKQMTGGEAISARFHYQEYFEFTPKFKLFIAGNHKPVIRGRDEGIWRRIRLIPFEVAIAPEKQDKHLQEKLRAELAGILNWAIKGCLDWQEAGLDTPRVITDAVNSYRTEMDYIAQWLGEACTVAPNLECKASTAYSSYRFWAEANGYRPMASGMFSRDFETRFTKVSRKDGNHFLGVRCR